MQYERLDICLFIFFEGRHLFVYIGWILWFVDYLEKCVGFVIKMVQSILFERGPSV